LPVRSCVIDGEAIACDQSGLAVFELVRHHRRGVDVVLCAFDLLELDGKDMRHVLIEDHKLVLANLLRQPHKGIAFNEHYSGEGAIIFKHACALGERYGECPLDGSRSGSFSLGCIMRGTHMGSRLSWQFTTVSDSKRPTLLRRRDQGVVNGLRAGSGVP
jgi:hypothetical protein